MGWSCPRRGSASAGGRSTVNRHTGPSQSSHGSLTMKTQTLQSIVYVDNMESQIKWVILPPKRPCRLAIGPFLWCLAGHLVIPPNPKHEPPAPSVIDSLRFALRAACGWLSLLRSGSLCSARPSSLAPHHSTTPPLQVSSSPSTLPAPPPPAGSPAHRGCAGRVSSPARPCLSTSPWGDSASLPICRRPARAGQPRRAVSPD